MHVSFKRAFILLIIHSYQTFFAFKKSESGSLINAQTHCIKNKWSKLDEYIITMDEEEQEKGVRQVGNFEHAGKPTKKDLELIYVGTKLDRKELKIEVLITIAERNSFDHIVTQFIP